MSQLVININGPFSMEGYAFGFMTHFGRMVKGRPIMQRLIQLPQLVK
jgi:hypothetical protein